MSTEQIAVMYAALIEDTDLLPFEEFEQMVAGATVQEVLTWFKGTTVN